MQGLSSLLEIESKIQRSTGIDEISLMQTCQSNASTVTSCGNQAWAGWRWVVPDYLTFMVNGLPKRLRPNSMLQTSLLCCSLGITSVNPFLLQSLQSLAFALATV